MAIILPGYAASSAMDGRGQCWVSHCSVVPSLLCCLGDALTGSPDLQPHFSPLGTSAHAASVLLPSGTMCLTLLRASARRRRC